MTDEDHRKILEARKSPPARRPLSVDRLDEIHARLEYLQWTLTQQPKPLVTNEWRYLLTDARDLLTAFAER
jgi:hypothetical protein